MGQCCSKTTKKHKNPQLQDQQQKNENQECEKLVDEVINCYKKELEELVFINDKILEPSLFITNCESLQNKHLDMYHNQVSKEYQDITKENYQEKLKKEMDAMQKEAKLFNNFKSLKNCQETMKQCFYDFSTQNKTEDEVLEQYKKQTQGKYFAIYEDKLQELLQQFKKDYKSMKIYEKISL